MTNGKTAVLGGLVMVAVAATASLFWSASPNAQPERTEDNIDLRLPDMTARKTGLGVTNAGCEKPARPDWVINAGPRDTNKVSLIIALYDIGRKSEIVSSRTCTCEIEYPSWDDAEQKFDELTAGIDDNQLIQILDEKTFEAGDLNKPALDICAASRKP